VFKTNKLVAQQSPKVSKLKQKDNCWICEGWEEHKFVARSEEAPVYLHFDFDGFKGDLMFEEGSQWHCVHRMVPPGSHSYFFSYNGRAFID